MTPARLARAALVFWLLSEGMHALASRALLPRRGRAAIEGDPTVIVLGFRNRHPERINAVNRWRADVAVRSLPAQPTRLIATGGSRAKGMSEAALIAAYLVEVHGMDSKTIVTEEASLSTWENIANVRPLLAGTGAVVIVSNPLHALRAPGGMCACKTRTSHGASFGPATTAGANTRGRSRCSRHTDCGTCWSRLLGCAAAPPASHPCSTRGWRTGADSPGRRAPGAAAG